LLASTILAIARQLYGPENFRSRVLELNASDERGIEVVRTKVKNFAQLAVGTSSSSKYPNPPYKIIILDEADSMTKDAQSALRRTMELYSRVTRFCLICNYVTKIIDPITSRCAKFRFKPLDKGAITERLNMVAQVEGILCTEDAIERLCATSRGDLRKAINLLQSAQLLAVGEREVSVDHVNSVAGSVPEEAISNFIRECALNRERTVESIQKQVKLILAEGFDISQFLHGLLDQVVRMEIEDMGKANVCLAIARADRQLSDGGDEYLNLLQVASALLSCC
jgi:replication factor C subunit 2/4